ncbi:MAG: hypothetical protein NT149_00055 [Candidatus Gottesmanbacteria bacterium]|nr:hypothetical protein [Candidatus Gottesmanbacteria bacterium]
MAVPTKEAKPDASPVTPPAGEQKLYSTEEAVTVARMNGYIGHDIYIFARVHTLEDRHDTSNIPDAILKRRKEIVDEVQALVHKILADRNKEEKKFTAADYDRYIDEHIELPEFGFMSAPPPTLNKGGWGFFAGLLNPLEQGIKIGPSETATRPDNWRSGH